MSKQSEQMESMSVADIKANPCAFCWACYWKKQGDCYKGSYSQCSVCSLLLQLIEKMESEQGLL